MKTIRTLNICMQRDTSCQGQHVDPEYMLTNQGWELTDGRGMGPVVETVERSNYMEGESDSTYYSRVSRRASEIDRRLGCPRCYR